MLRQLIPVGDGPKFIIRNRDAKFGGMFDRVTKGAGLRVLGVNDLLALNALPCVAASSGREARVRPPDSS